MNSKLKLVTKESQTRETSKALKNYDASVHPKGETLPYCVRVFGDTTFLKADVKIDGFRDVLKGDSAGHNEPGTCIF